MLEIIFYKKYLNKYKITVDIIYFNFYYNNDL